MPGWLPFYRAPCSVFARAPCPRYRGRPAWQVRAPARSTARSTAFRPYLFPGAGRTSLLACPCVPSSLGQWGCRVPPRAHAARRAHPHVNVQHVQPNALRHGVPLGPVCVSVCACLCACVRLYSFTPVSAIAGQPWPARSSISNPPRWSGIKELPWPQPPDREGPGKGGGSGSRCSQTRKGAHVPLSRQGVYISRFFPFPPLGSSLVLAVGGRRRRAGRRGVRERERPAWRPA